MAHVAVEAQKVGRDSCKSPRCKRKSSDSIGLTMVMKRITRKSFEIRAISYSQGLEQGLGLGFWILGVGLGGGFEP